MIFSGSNNPLMLIHKDMYYQKESEVMDIMLSPQFYTHKREYMDIKYLYRAKKLAPSVLENLLPQDHEYEYYVYREGESWVFIAYETQQISEFLETKGISPDQISKLYFAQQAREMFLTPLSLNENEALSTLQKSVTVVPKILLSYSTRYREFDETYRPSLGISFGAGADSLFTQKESSIIGVIFLLFGLIFFVESFRFKSILSERQEQTSHLYEEYPSLKSKYSRDNIIKKYKKIDRIERHKREILKEVSHFVLPGVEVDNLHMDEKILSATLHTPDAKSLTEVESLAKSKKYQTKRGTKENTIIVETTL